MLSPHSVTRIFHFYLSDSFSITHTHISTLTHWETHTQWAVGQFVVEVIESCQAGLRSHTTPLLRVKTATDHNSQHGSCSQMVTMTHTHYTYTLADTCSYIINPSHMCEGPWNTASMPTVCHSEGVGCCWQEALFKSWSSLHGPGQSHCGLQLWHRFIQELYSFACKVSDSKIGRASCRERV